MNAREANSALARGVLPHLEQLEGQPFAFDFGLAELPTEPGIVLVRGPRQYGKSPWLGA
jgi:uncharacterized protein